MYSQSYDPFGNGAWSVAAAAAPIAVLLSSLAFFRVKSHWAALIGFFAALFVATLVFGMPTRTALSAAGYGAACGLFPVGWTLLAAAFFHQLNDKRGVYLVLRDAAAATATPDRRVLAILGALACGSLFAGAAGTTAAIGLTSALLVGLGFDGRAAALLALVGSAASSAFAGFGAPVAALAAASGLELGPVAVSVARALAWIALCVPLLLVVRLAGWRAALGAWPAAATAGIATAITTVLVASFAGPALVDLVAGAAAGIAVLLLLRFWKPREPWLGSPARRQMPARHRWRDIAQAWLPWVIVVGAMLLWSVPMWKAWLDRQSVLQYAWPLLHEQVRAVPPAVMAPVHVPAIYTLNWLSDTGTGVLVAAIVSGLALGYRPIDVLRVLIETAWNLRGALFTIAVIAALAGLSRYAGFDATIGGGFVDRGPLWPFFSALLGALGVALTGSSSASNAVLGTLQATAAGHLGVDPQLMAAAQGAGSSAGTMIEPVHALVATHATRSGGLEGSLLRQTVMVAFVLALVAGLAVTVATWAR